ncbi:MAG: hypothetical protein PHV60_07960 [bacterium]|nr:hypothetical protein [bacterium]
MELQITWKNTFRIWWSYAWRNLIAIAVAFVAGMIIGGITGGIMGFLGIDLRTIKIVTGTMGFIVGLGISIVPMKMILGKDFGEFRLVLLSKENVNPENNAR